MKEKQSPDDFTFFKKKHEWKASGPLTFSLHRGLADTTGAGSADIADEVRRPGHFYPVPENIAFIHE